MFFGKGDNASRKGNSLLRFAGQEDPRARAGGAYVSLGTPEPAPTAAEIHRRARSRRERVENAYLAELANLPKMQAGALTQAAPSEPSRAAPQAPPPPRPQIPSVLDAFAKIDAVIAGRGRARASSPAAEPAAAEGGGLFMAPRNGGSDAWRPLIDPYHIIAAVKNWKAPIIGLGMLGAAMGVLTALSTPKFYYASAEISIDPRGLKVIDNGVNPDGFVSDTFAIVDSQVRLMTSPEVLEKVVQDLNLQDNSEFNGDLKSRWLDILTGMFLRQDAKSDKSIAAAEYLADHIYVERGAKTYNINVTSASVNPVKAAEIANRVVAVYVEKQRKQQSATVQQTTDELTERLAALKESVEKSEQAVEAYKSENDLIGVEGRLIDDEAILRVNDQLSAAKGQTINLNARAKSIKSLTPESVVDGGESEEVSSPVLTGLRSQYSSAKRTRDGMASKLGPRHPERIQAESELESLRAGIAAEIRRISASMQAELRRAIQTEQDLAAHLAQLKVKQGSSGADLVKLRELQRDASAKAQVYEAFKLRAMQTAEQVNLNTADIKEVVSARPPKETQGTSRKLMVLSGFLGGLALGLALAILKGIIDSIRSQLDEDGAAPGYAPAPDSGGGGGGIFRPRRDLETQSHAREAAVAPPHVQRLAEAFAPARAPAPAQEYRHEPSQSPQPQPPQPPIALPASAPHHYVQLEPFWHPQPQVPHPGFVPAGPMMYPQPVIAPQPVYAPPPAFAPVPPPMQIWPQPSPFFAFQQPVNLQMPAPPMPMPPQFYAPAPAPQPAPAAAVPALHPFAQEAVQPRPPAAGPPAPPRPHADDRLSQIQESIDEFRSALTDLAKQRRAS
jgi:polysaccharide biosynthesis transport protein